MKRKRFIKLAQSMGVSRNAAVDIANATASVGLSHTEGLAATIKAMEQIMDEMITEAMNSLFAVDKRFINLVQ